MIASVLRLELRRSRSLLGWLTATMVLYTAFMTLYYPTIKANQATLDAMIRMWPKEMLAAFNMQGNLTDVGTFYNVYVFMMIWPIVAAIGGILIATRAVAADLDRGFLELPLAGRISRPAYLATSIAGQAIGMAVMVAATIATILLSGPLIGESWDVGRFAVAGLVAFAFGCSIAAATTLLAVVTLSRGLAGGVVAALLIAMYLLQALAQIDPNLERLRYASVFRYADTAPLLNAGTFPSEGLVVLGGVSIACWLAAVWAFRRRDLLA